MDIFSLLHHAAIATAAIYTLEHHAFAKPVHRLERRIQRIWARHALHFGAAYAAHLGWTLAYAALTGAGH